MNMKCFFTNCYKFNSTNIGNKLFLQRMSLKEERKDYIKGELNEGALPNNPTELLQSWLKVAKAAVYSDYNAMVVSSVRSTGFPASRVVLLRELTPEGLIFYTNYNSDKGQELINNPKATCNFFWREIEKQVRISGLVEKVSKEISDDYFSKRPRASQIGAWASDQSSLIENRELLEEKAKFFQEKFEGQAVPRPEHWGGFIIVPNEFEFWQGRASRLHDRILFEKANEVWKVSRLSP